MRSFPAWLLLVLACAGCFWKRGAASAPSSSPARERILAGRVVRINPQARFVVLNFPIGQMPPVDSWMNVFREGLKVGEVKITGPQREDHIVADLFSGEARVGDEVLNR